MCIVYYCLTPLTLRSTSTTIVITSYQQFIIIPSFSGPAGRLLTPLVACCQQHCHLWWQCCVLLCVVCCCNKRSMLRVKKYQLSIDITVPLNISMVFLRSGKTFDVIVERNAMAWSEATIII